MRGHLLHESGVVFLQYGVDHGLGPVIGDKGLQQVLTFEHEPEIGDPLPGLGYGIDVVELPVLLGNKPVYGGEAVYEFLRTHEVLHILHPAHGFRIFNIAVKVHAYPVHAVEILFEHLRAVARGAVFGQQFHKINLCADPHDAEPHDKQEHHSTPHYNPCVVMNPSAKR